MNLNFITEVWDAITQHMSASDRPDAADSLVNLLIDNDYEAEDIKEAFRGNREVLTALKEYADSVEIEEDYDEDDDDYDEE
jgi:hypothetical protein